MLANKFEWVSKIKADLCIYWFNQTEYNFLKDDQLGWQR